MSLDADTRRAAAMAAHPSNQAPARPEFAKLRYLLVVVAAFWTPILATVWWLS